MERVKKHTLHRKNLLNDMQILYDLAQRAQTDRTVRNMFKIRSRELETVKEGFLKQHDALISVLLSLPDTEPDDEEPIRQSFFDQFYVVKTIMAEMFGDEGSASLNVTHMPLNTTSSPASCIRLPKLEIPKFTGDWKTFSSFLDLFDSVVHSNDSLSEVEKFKYLRAALEGPPLGLILNLKITADNYVTAYNLVVNRYTNKRRCAKAHWDAIINVPKLTALNTASLSNLIDTFQQNLAALKTLGLPTDEWDYVMFMMMFSRLDSDTIKMFELESKSPEIPTFQKLIEFLETQLHAYDNYADSNILMHTPANSSSLNKDARTQKPPARNRSSAFIATKSPASNCILCKQAHALYTCSNFANKSPIERYNMCKRFHICLNCLSSGHDVRHCRSFYTCKKCNSKMHHTLLHFDKSNNDSTPQNLVLTTPSSSQTPSPSVEGSNSPNTTYVGLGTGSNKTYFPKKDVLLATAVVETLDSRGFPQTLRCLLDTGSMTSFITLKAVNRLGLIKSKCSIEVNGLDSMTTSLHNGKVTLSIKPRGRDSPNFNFDAIILDKICEKLPMSKICLKSWTHIINIPLADSKFNSPGAIDLLCGAELFSKILLNDKISGRTGEPDAISTVFGYILMGEIDTKSPSITTLLCNPTRNLNVSLDRTLTKFWELENVPDAILVNPEDIECENHFKKTYRRDASGKFTVSLPFRDISCNLSNIRDVALQRFYALERRLVKQPDLYTNYCDFMREYIALNHMQVVSKEETGQGKYYIPHHCVLKPESSTTKLRVVFNASAKVSNKPSLNDCLYTGPKLQQDIFSILLNFRLHNFVLCADIKQMYRMIWISEKDRDFQRIFWRFSPQDEIQEYVLRTVVYGVSSSPYLALRTLRQLAHDEIDRFPQGANAIYDFSYIDDFVCGSETLDDARVLLNELIDIMKSGGFELRKWASNEPSLLSKLPPSYLQKNPLNFASDNDCTLKVLGLQWNPQTDCFSFLVRPRENASCTKRLMLSELARIYDPLGFLSPITFFTKYLIQRLWVSGLGFDDIPSHDIVRIWEQYKLELPLLSQVQIPRKLILNSSDLELHGFCDASERGFACIIYARNIDSNGKISVSFISSKSKVSPLKKITIPRLELSAAVLLSKLMSFVVKTYKTVKFSRVYAWSDSQIALHWIRNSPHKYKTFVANRVAYIQERIPPNVWYYINTKHNPADAASRGLLPSEFVALSEWIKGPTFLFEPQITSFEAPASLAVMPPSEEELKLSLFTFANEPHFIDKLLEVHSSFNFINRTVAYTLRFLYNIRNPANKRSGILRSLELHDALLLMIKRAQQLHFLEELSKREFSKPLRKLNVFIDDSNIIRVGGRLKNSTLRYDTKYPLLLPRNCRFTTLLIDYYHQKYLHAGFRTTQFLIAQKFWILSQKRAINSVLSKCVKCWKTAPKTYEPPMGNLPVSRISMVKPFSHSGVDFGGPFHITMSRYRGVKTCKAYLCLFVCLATKALHLELASSLSAECFLAALQRFIARRGRVSDIYCDNGTNFTAADKELKTLMVSAASKESIVFHYSPPAGSHFGGIWEAGIKSVKTHLKRVVGEQILTYEEFYTVLALIESILNSRPLTAMSNDIEDINILTPGHFLTLEPLTAIPLPDMTSLQLNRLSRWQLLQRLHQDFWNRWQKEYLHSLQQRSKWLKPTSPLPTVGTIVLVKDENLPPCRWNLARITELHLGNDDVARVATIRTASGTLKRPLNKLCPLPDSHDP